MGTGDRPGQHDDGGRVVVAVGPATGSAVDWAAAEAAARGCRLHVVHVARLRLTVDPYGLVPMADVWSDRATALRILREAVRRARSVAPDVDVVAELAFGSALPSILRRSHEAQLLVLGSRTAATRGRPADRLAFSVWGRAASRAACQVAVVPPLPSSPHAGSAPRVVVGVDGRATCGPVLGVAFRAAAQRGVTLTAVHAWSPDAPADLEAVCGPVAATEARAEELVHRALEPWRACFAGVPVSTRVCVGDPVTTVLRESEGAALVVVGSGTRGRNRRRIFGSVSNGVARRASCPVVVIRSGTGTADADRGSGRPSVVPGVDPIQGEPVDPWRTPWE